MEDPGPPQPIPASETAREAQKKFVEARRRNARAAREKLGKWLESDLREVYEAYRRGFTAQTDQAYRASDAVMYQVYGRAPTELELSAGEAGSVSLTIESCFELGETSSAE
jgi:hypothetical protein